MIRRENVQTDDFIASLSPREFLIAQFERRVEVLRQQMVIGRSLSRTVSTASEESHA